MQLKIVNTSNTAPKRAFTVKFTAQILLEKGLISKIQHKNIITNANTKRAALKKLEASTYPENLHQGADFISPVEIISSFNIEIPGKKDKILSEDMMTEAIAEEVGLPYKKIDPLKLNLDIVTAYIPRPYALRHLIIPIDEKNGIVTIAVVNPFNLEAAESLKKARKIETHIVLCSKSDILKIVREFFGYRASVVAAEAEISPTMELETLEQYVLLKGQNEIEATDHHIVNAVEYLLHYAFDQRASDIHIEPKRGKSIVRIRIDGVMHNIHTIPRTVHAPILSRFKMLSRMNIAEKRKPQDGRIKTKFRGKEIELRVSTLPVAFGEKVVIRIFDPDVLLQDVSQLGFSPEEYRIYNSFIKKPNGIILVTGPTGSGKTTTLYSSLKELASPEVNIITIEDPIEMVMEEFNQVGVRPAIDLTFANILRTILRQDPDIIMVGEIRDRETAENAVQSALTGHLVLSTLHTNDAPSSVTRLLDLGIPAFLISSTIIGIIAQRLLRKVCAHCKKEKKLTAEEIEHLQIEDKAYTVCYGEGCVECRGTGYRGRTGIFEVMKFTDRVKDVLSGQADLKALYEAAKADGMSSLRQAAVKKMLKGITTYKEVIAVT